MLDYGDPSITKHQSSIADRKMLYITYNHRFMVVIYIGFSARYKQRDSAEKDRNTVHCIGCLFLIHSEIEWEDPF